MSYSAIYGCTNEYHSAQYDEGNLVGFALHEEAHERCRDVISNAIVDEFDEDDSSMEEDEEEEEESSSDEEYVIQQRGGRRAKKIDYKKFNSRGN